MSANPIPETFNRQDWPRLVARKTANLTARISALELTPGGALSLDLDGGTVTGVSGSSFDFDGGGA